MSFAFPTRTLHMARPEDLEHPDRPPNTEEALDRGVSAARNIAERGLASLGGAAPPPVDLGSPPLWGTAGSADAEAWGRGLGARRAGLGGSLS